MQDSPGGQFILCRLVWATKEDFLFLEEEIDNFIKDRLESIHAYEGRRPIVKDIKQSIDMNDGKIATTTIVFYTFTHP